MDMRSGVAGRSCFALALASIAGTVARGPLLAQTSPSTLSGIYTEAQAKRGSALYAESCALCHGGQLAGGDLAPPLKGPAFVEKWRGRPLGEVFDYMRVLMPLHSPGGLNRQQNADILAFMLQQSEFPAGAADLPSEGDALNHTTMLPNHR